jgi:2-succinyl-5-enolpyruvyl-6-hydroxy-3-cyclohexene-1-carboxylate synthase
VTEAPAQVFAANFLANLAAQAEVRHIYLAPGARSQALAVAAEQLASAGRVKLHVRIDERSMAFSALGTALATQTPVILITTSGTAVANLHPAVLEAHHSGVPLILLTADRPAELRGVGANQTTEQVGLFGPAVPMVFDVEAPSADVDEAQRAIDLAGAVSASVLGHSGPVQVNLAFREPLSSAVPDASVVKVGEKISAQDEPELEWAILDATLATVVIAGAGAGEEAVELAESFGWPLFAEPSSGARFGLNAIVGYRRLLQNQHDLAQQIRRVIVFGKPTLSRQVTKLFFEENIETVVVRSKTHGHFDLARRAAQFVDEISVDSEVDFAWLAAWRAADAENEFAFENKLDRANLVRELYLASDQNDCIVLGASRLIREADSMAPAKPIAVFSNRGLAGIDGTIATATGIAIANHDFFSDHGVESIGITRALMGDITALHDAGSLAFDHQDSDLNLQVIVGNDGGGTIFETLEIASTIDDQAFDRLFRTRQNVDFWHLAEAYGWQYIRVETLEQLAPALQTRGRALIEVLLY